MLRPRPSVNKKVIISALTVILVVASIVIASFTAFGRTTAPKQPDPVINNPADVLDIQQSPPSTPIFDEPEPANPETNGTVPTDSTPTENPEEAEPVVEPGESGTEDDSETASDPAATDPGGEYPSNQESPEGCICPIRFSPANHYSRKNLEWHPRMHGRESHGQHVALCRKSAGTLRLRSRHL